MIVFFVFILFFVFSFLRPFMLEMERRDALLLNATLSKNETHYIREEWLGNVTEKEHHEKSIRASIKPDWSVVLGTFHHTKDENFEEYLTAAGLSFFTRAIILSTSPTISLDRVFQGDDYYYDLSTDDHPDVKYEDVGGGGGDEEDGKVFQMVITTTFVVTLTQRFRLGQPFIKQDFDGTPSKNTCNFVAPNVLFHYKEKAHVNTSIIHTFDRAGLITTIISGRTGMQARRHFRREGVDA